ncbi:MAG TPA: phosphoketolase family protein [Polyangiaceae bacterium]|nr:phosphoketolase family protein [Polyangiaceae bacterium]
MATISDRELADIDAWWRAANYLSVGQIYLLDNALLTEPLTHDHIKPRLLGHWGTSPGLSLIYAHLNRIIRARDENVLYLTGPGHGGPAILANVWLEGAYTDVYPEVTRDGAGMRRLFRQFSTPGGVPSHVGPPTPGSIHEGGELGYVLTHAFGAVFDNPDLIAVAVVGDGEAETGPLEGSWKGIRFLDPSRDGAVLPILHLNGYKISGPTVLGRASNDSIRSLLTGHGYDPIFVEGSDPVRVHRALADALDSSFDRIRDLQRVARETSVPGASAMERSFWPMIVMRTPKGWTGPKEVDGLPVEGTFRAHQVPLTEPKRDAHQLAMLEAWMKSYRPEELFDGSGRPIERLTAIAPKGPKRMGANPHANGGTLSVPLELPDIARYAIDVKKPGALKRESTRQFGEMLRDIYKANPKNFRLVCPDETNSNRLGAVFETESRTFEERTISIDDHVSPHGRVMEVLSEHNCEGWLEGYLLTGRHGVFATYEAFALIVASMATQHAKWLEMCSALPWRAPVPSLNYLLTSTCWRNDHNGFSHQGPGFMDVILSKKATVSRIYLPPDANCLLSTAEHCLKSTNYVNLIIIDKQPELQWLDLQAAKAHCAEGAGVWTWACHPGDKAHATHEHGDSPAERQGDDAPDVVLACAGDVPTMEALAAAQWLRDNAPELAVRVVNVVDLMSLPPKDEHPHGLSAERFNEIFTEDTDVVFAFHGYAAAVHALLHGRPRAGRFHVRGYQEEGTTTTPFDMVVLNGISRYHLAMEAMRRSRRPPKNLEGNLRRCKEMLEKHHRYIREHFEDLPEITAWTWS